MFNGETKNELLKKLIFFFLSEITEQSLLEIFDDKQHYLKLNDIGRLQSKVANNYFQLKFFE